MIEGDSIDGILYYDINILSLQIAQGDQCVNWKCLTQEETVIASISNTV